MTNLASLQHHNQRLIKYCLEKCYPDGVITLERLLEDNLINGTQVAEMAVCRTNPVLEICPVGIGRDLTDDSDVKTITVQDEKGRSWIKKNKVRTGEYKDILSRRACVNEIKNKIGKLRVICYNPFNEGWTFFVIPNEAFSHLKKISITFDRESHLPNGKYSIYQVPNWNILCQ